MKNPIKVSPSILAADFGRLNEEINSVESQADFIHVDVMDGHFVPNITFGYTILNSLKTRLPVDCHLMIENPVKHINEFKIRSDRIATHIELEKEMTARSIELTKKHGKSAGVAISPETPVEALIPFFGLADFFIVMTVNPGFGGQEFRLEELAKVAYLRKKFPKTEIVIDGGMNTVTAPLAVTAGADNLVAGSFIFRSPDRIKALNFLKNLKPESATIASPRAIFSSVKNHD